MHATLVDERDVNVEVDGPRFRVHVFEPNRDGDYNSTAAYDVTECEVTDAIRFAEEQAGPNGLYSVGVVYDEELDSTRVVIWVLGADVVHAGNPSASEQAILDRMMLRRGRTVLADE